MPITLVPTALSKCQSLARAEWLEKRQAELLPAYFMSCLLCLSRCALPYRTSVNVRSMFRATAETLQQIGSRPPAFGAQIGFFCVLHTWGQDSHRSPHLHCVVPVAELPGWQPLGACRRHDFFLPVPYSRTASETSTFVTCSILCGGKVQFHGDLKRWSDPTASLNIWRRSATGDG